MVGTFEKKTVITVAGIITNINQNGTYYTTYIMFILERYVFVLQTE